jgi:DNA polymerase elongation subunit (family B)
VVNIEQKNNALVISYVDSTGDISFRKIPIPAEEYYEWVYSDRDADPVMKSWDGKKVKKQASKFLNKYRITEFLMKQPQSIQDEIFALNIPKKYYCDIETEILDEFADSKNPKCAIQTIAIANDKDYIMVMGTKPFDDKNKISVQNKLNEYFKSFNKTIKFEYKYFSSEYDMLHSFFTKAIKKLPLITGWNFVDFDWAYLTARAARLNIDITECSPTKEFDKNNLPMHKIIVDYMEVYKKWDKVIWMKESNGLDYVAEAALKVRKIKFSGSLTDLYRNDYEGFVYYNAVDSYLVRLIDEKLNTLMPYFTLAHLTRVEQDKVWSPVTMVENLMVQQLMKDRKRVFIKKEMSKFKAEKYDGAWVMQPIPGFYKFLATFDYASEYPTNIRQWNISPDVFIKKDKNATFTEDTIITSSGAIFRKNEDGVLRTLLTHLFNQRYEAKHSMGEVEEEINYLEEILKSK